VASAGAAVIAGFWGREKVAEGAVEEAEDPAHAGEGKDGNGVEKRKVDTDDEGLVEVSQDFDVRAKL